MKKAILVSISLIVINLISTDLSSAIDTEGAIAIWLFNEGTGDVALDSSGSGNDGELVGPQWAEGVFGAALEFDGAGNHVYVGDFADYSDQVTLVAMIKTSEASDWNDIIVGPCSDVIFTVHNNLLNFAGQCMIPIPHNTYSTTQLTDDDWHSVAGVYDGQQVSLYVDGEMEASNPAGGVFTPGPKYIGSRDDGEEAYNGLIDELGFFNVALSADEIAEIANMGLSEALGYIAVSPSGRLATTWASIKK